MKKSIITTLVLTVFALFNSLQAHNNPINCAKAELPSGTLVNLEIIEQVQSNKVTVGHLVKCRITTDVVVDGKVVIRTGAVATARVSAIAPTTYNEGEKITLRAINAQAADGQIIALNGTEQTVKGRLPNQAVTAHIGTPLNAHVTNNCKIDL